MYFPAGLKSHAALLLPPSLGYKQVIRAAQMQEEGN